MLVKVFERIDYSALGKTVQDWLDANPRINIRFVAQSQEDDPIKITMTIFYTK